MGWRVLVVLVVLGGCGGDGAGDLPIQPPSGPPVTATGTSGQAGATGGAGVPVDATGQGGGGGTTGVPDQGAQQGPAENDLRPGGQQGVAGPEGFAFEAPVLQGGLGGLPGEDRDRGPIDDLLPGDFFNGGFVGRTIGR